MAMKKPENRDEAFYVVNTTLNIFKRRLSKALGWTIPRGAFNDIMNEVMRSVYPPKKNTRRRSVPK